MQALVVIPFRQANLLLINHEGQPFVPMKPVVDGMGLDWKSQHVKLTTGRLSSTMVEITTVAEDGKQRQMTCLPLRKLPGWMMSIHPNKVRPELRDNIIAYQNECDDVLWSYWNEDETTNLRKSQTPKAGTLERRRWLLTLQSNGEERIESISEDTCIVTIPELILAIASGELGLTSTEIYKLSLAITTQMQSQLDHAHQRIRKAQQAGLSI